MILPLAALLANAAPDKPQQPKADIDEVLSKIGAQSTRRIDTDICYPADAEEYAALGKTAFSC